MVKFTENSYSYDYSFPTVSLAYFIRYPNPFATHVLSTDVIDRHVDSTTGRLYTTRIIRKQSRLPPAVMKLMPKNILGNGARGPNGEAQNLLLEKSVVDLKEGWMETETQNLQYRGVLSVVEKQRYARPQALQMASPGDAWKDSSTDVTTNVTFKSRFSFGRKDDTTPVEEEKKSFFGSWSSSALQRTIESTSLNRTLKGLAKSREGMQIVMERIREGGIMGALEQMRRDRDMAMSMQPGMLE